jgi:heme/copper-type cytochrome/quinol oxidase subunit 2
MRFALNPRLRLAGFALVVTVLIALIVLASRSATVPSAEERANAGPLIAIVHLIEIVGIAAELLALLLLVTFFRPSRRRKDDEDQIYHEPVRVHWAVKLLISAFPLLVLTGLIFVLMRMHPLVQPPPPAPVEVAPPPSGSGGVIEQVIANLELGWWEVLLAGTLAGAAFIAILLALRTPPPSPRTKPEPGEQASVLATAVTAGLRDARREPDPRRAVIAAYATMERILAARGLPRREVEAPLEYMTRLFAERTVSDEALATLTDLFELARFSHHPIGPAARERAIAALTRIEQELQEVP